jgi:hypothetical protein
MFTLPFICVVCNICPYGIDLWLWLSHFFRLAVTFFLTVHADTIGKRIAALNSQTSSRILYFVNVKAVLNTIMVTLGWKLPGAFKETKKASTGPKPIAESHERESLVTSSIMSCPALALDHKESVSSRHCFPTVTVGHKSRCCGLSNTSISSVGCGSLAAPCRIVVRGSPSPVLADACALASPHPVPAALDHSQTMRRSVRTARKVALPVAESFEGERTATLLHSRSCTGSGRFPSRRQSGADTLLTQVCFSLLTCLFAMPGGPIGCIAGEGGEGLAMSPCSAGQPTLLGNDFVRQMLCSQLSVPR